MTSTEWRRYGKTIHCMAVSLIPESPDFRHGEYVKHPLWILGRNLEFMSEVDIVVFTPGWKNHKNCKIEHVCAMEYNIEAIEL